MDTKPHTLEYLANVLRPYRLHDLNDVCERFYVNSGDQVRALPEASILARAAELSRTPIRGEDGFGDLSWTVSPDERGLPYVHMELERGGEQATFSVLKPFTPERMINAVLAADDEGANIVADYLLEQLDEEDRADTLRYLCEDADESVRCQMGAERLAHAPAADRLLREAIAGNQVQAAVDALAVGANVNATDFRGNTILHEAARLGHHAVLRPLLDAGAWVEEANGQGQTPLHLAAGQGHAQACLVLMAYGADSLRRDALGRTPADLTQPVVEHRREQAHEQGL